VRRLTEIALAATRYWEYPEDWIERWRDELTHRPETLATQDVLVAEVAGEIIAVCSVSIETDEAELEGCGCCLRASVAALADPQAEGFYRRQGARRIGEVSPPAGRALPLPILDLGE
jgi:hypothetical protein